MRGLVHFPSKMHRTIGRESASGCTFTIVHRGNEQLEFQIGGVKFQQNEYFREILGLFPEYTTLASFSGVYETIWIN
jgi:hypothetical protein